MAIAVSSPLYTLSGNTSAATGLTTSSCTFPAGTLGVDVLGVALIACSASSSGGAAQTFTLHDNLGTPNNWNIAVTANDPTTTHVAAQHLCIAYFNYPAGTNVSSTLTWAWQLNTNERTAWVGYVTGHDSANPFDQGNTQTDATSATTSNVSTSASVAAGNLIMTIWGARNNAASPTAGYPYATGLLSSHEGVRSQSVAIEYDIPAGAGVYTTGTYTFGASSQGPSTWAIASFNAASGGGGGGPTPANNLAALGVG